MPEPIDPEWGLCDHDLLPAGYRDDEDYDDEWDDYDERYDDDDEPLGASMARLAADIEFGRHLCHKQPRVPPVAHDVR